MSSANLKPADPTVGTPLVVDDDIIYLNQVVHVELECDDLKRAHLNLPPSVRVTFVGGSSVEFTGDRADRLRAWFRSLPPAIVV